MSDLHDSAVFYAACASSDGAVLLHRLMTLMRELARAIEQW